MDNRSEKDRGTNLMTTLNMNIATVIFFSCLLAASVGLFARTATSFTTNTWNFPSCSDTRWHLQTSIPTACNPSVIRAKSSSFLYGRIFNLSANE